MRTGQMDVPFIWPVAAGWPIQLPGVVDGLGFSVVNVHQEGRERPSRVGTGRVAVSDNQCEIAAGDRVVVTGAAGFIGSAVARAVRAKGAHVVALVEPGADARNLDAIDAEQVTADIRDAATVRSACAGARFVFHLAAIYRFW